MVRLFNAVEGRKGKDETGMKKHKQKELTEEQSVKLYALEDRFEEKLNNTLSALFLKIEERVGLSPKDTVAAGCAIVVMRLVRMQLLAARVQPHEPTGEEMSNAVRIVQEAMASAVYDIGSRVFASRAESN